MGEELALEGLVGAESGVEKPLAMDVVAEAAAAAAELGR